MTVNYNKLWKKLIDLEMSRTQIRRAEEKPRGEPLHSVCSNEKNKKSASDTH